MLQDCPFKDKEECRLLHMTDCGVCPLSQDEGADKVIEKIELFKRDTEGVDISGLFSGEECRLCRNTPKKKAGFMIYDLGHVSTAKKKERGWRKIFRSGGEEYDILLPLQFNCCSACRKNIWWNNNLVTVTTLALVLLTLIPVSIELSAEKLRAVHRLMPMFVLVAAGLIGFFGGKLLHKKLSKKWESETMLKLSEHPASVALFKLGWRPALVNSSGKESVMFTRKPLERGLGTAPAPEKEETGDAAAPAEEAESGADTEQA